MRDFTCGRNRGRAAGRLLLCVQWSVAAALAAGGASPWDLKELSRPPEVFAAQTTEPGVRALYFAAVPYQGRPTRVFAYYGAPAGRRSPGMVLVHGGGGTAFAEWVRLWNRRGYAAIAIDTAGNEPEAARDDPWNPPRHRQPYGGPSGAEVFKAIDEPERDQWPYQAVAAVILAHSLLRSFPEVDARHTGVTGISWGGYLTDIAAGVDPRFRFAAPVYGCGYLGEDSTWLKDLGSLGEAREKRWLSLWDPSVYLGRARMPMLWVSGTNDFAYPLPSLRKSYRLPRGPRTLSIRVRMTHNHSAGAAPEEIAAFADAVLKKKDPLARILEARQGVVTFRSRTPVVKAELNFTRDRGAWKERKWETVPAVLDAGRGRATADVPADATAYYFNLTDARGLVVSSEYETGRTP